MLERCTRPFGATRLYARVSSSHVWSGRLSISSLSTDQSTGDSQPPPFMSGSTVPVSRWRCTQRISVAAPIAKRAATSLYVSVRDSYARTARSRSSLGYGFGMGAIDHKSALNSSEKWSLGDGGARNPLGYGEFVRVARRVQEHAVHSAT